MSMIDLLLTDAVVHTLDEGHPRARSVAIHQGRVFALDPEGVRARREIDLQGATVVPGFGDAHNHMAWFGQSLEEIALAGLPDLEALYAAVAERAATLPGDAWVVGSGYDDTTLGGHPHRRELDRAAGGRKVWLKHRSGHVCTVNSPVLALIGDRPVPEGGVVVTDADGPTGTLEEQAQNLVGALVVPHPLADLSAAIRRAAAVYASEGLTHVTECGVGGGWIGRSGLELGAYQQAGPLPVRVQVMPVSDALHPLRGHATDPDRFGLDLGLRTGFGDDMLRLGPMKIFLDGSLVARTAAMLHPFCDRHSHGYLQDDAEQLRRRVVDAHVSGWTVAAHAIGDRAVDLALDTFAEAQEERPRPEVRHRIEHAAVTTEAQIARMADLRVTPVPQARFLYEIGDTMAAAVGPERADALYRVGAFHRAGLRVPGSSDRPVALGAPLLGIQSMVQRRTRDGAVLGPDERVPVEAALRAYTLDAAWIAGDERVRGSLTPGKHADLVVLGDDLLSLPADRIGATQVVATLLGGRPTHGSTTLGLDPEEMS
jgi:predicted amidohydrolase YtcJ